MRCNMAVQADESALMHARSTPKLTVIIEWENVRRSELERARRMLRTLKNQVEEQRMAKPVEVLILYDDEVIPGEGVQALLAEVLGTNNKVLDVRVETAPGLHYYDLKNHGAQRASGDLLLFLDSDVIPESDWLQSLVAAAANEDVHVVGGDAFIEPDGLVAKAFSVFWFFNSPEATVAPDKSSLQRRSQFFANNVLFDRETFLAHPFPKMPDGMTRGACLQLARNLEDAGIPVYRELRARVSHPAPNGWRHFFTRAMAQGRDRVFRKGESFGLRQSCNNIRSSLAHLWRTLRSRDLRLGHRISLAEAPIVLAIGVLYVGTRFVGEVAARRFPSFVRTRFRI